MLFPLKHLVIICIHIIRPYSDQYTNHLTISTQPVYHHASGDARGARVRRPDLRTVVARGADRTPGPAGEQQADVNRRVLCYLLDFYDVFVGMNTSHS